MTTRDRPNVVERVGSGTLCLRVLAAALSLTANVVVGGVLGPEQFGLYGLGISFGLIAAFVVGRSAGTLLVRLIGSHDARQEWALLAGAVLAVNRMALLLSAAAMVVIALLAIVAFAGTSTILLSLLLVPLVARSMIGQSTLRGMHRFWAALVPEMVLRNGGLLMLVLAHRHVLGVPTLTANRAMAFTIAAATIELMVVTLLARRALPSAARAVRPESRTREWMIAWVPLVLAQVVVMLEQNVSVWLVSRARTAAELGMFVAAYRYAGAVAMIFVSFAFVLGPIVARSHALGARAELESAAMRAARMMLSVGAPVIGLVVLFRHELLALIGPEFVGAGDCLAILMIGQLVNAACGSVAACVVMMGQARAFAIAMAAATALNLCTALVLVPRLGIDGAAVAQSVSMGFWNVALAWFAWRHCGVHVTVLGYLWRRPAR